MKFMWQTQVLDKQLKGTYYGKDPSKTWSLVIPIENKPINYLEIGTLHGRNLIKVANSYCNHPNSKLYCIDPWFDYDGYSEYKNQQETSWKIFNENIDTAKIRNKVEIHRDLSENVVPTLPNDYFDIIFIDGNHETEYVYKDGVMSFDKLKSGGYMIFDDYFYVKSNWPETRIGVNNFIETYKDKIEIITLANSFYQCILKKL